MANVVVIPVAMTEQDTQGKPDGAKQQPTNSAKDPAEDFKEGLNLLWKAALGTADEIKKEVDKGGVGDALRDAGRELEVAAAKAASTLESFLDRVSPAAPKYEKNWPEQAQEAAAKEGDPPTQGGAATDKDASTDKDAKEPEDGGEKDGERRDMRIQLDD